MDGEVLKVKRRSRRFHSEDVTVFDAVIYAGRKTKQDMVKMNSMRVFAFVAMAMGVCAVMAAEKTVVSSPDGKNEIRLYANPLTYEDAQRYVHETRQVKAGEKMPFHMAPGGGFVARCSRMSP